MLSAQKLEKSVKEETGIVINAEARLFAQYGFLDIVIKCDEKYAGTINDYLSRMVIASQKDGIDIRIQAHETAQWQYDMAVKEAEIIRNEYADDLDLFNESELNPVRDNYREKFILRIKI